jgi:hypothetical protein
VAGLTGRPVASEGHRARPYGDSLSLLKDWLLLKLVFTLVLAEELFKCVVWKLELNDVPLSSLLWEISTEVELPSVVTV